MWHFVFCTFEGLQLPLHLQDEYPCPPAFWKFAENIYKDGNMAKNTVYSLNSFHAKIPYKSPNRDGKTIAIVNDLFNYTKYIYMYLGSAHTDNTYFE